jgi:plastocyanin
VLKKLLVVLALCSFVTVLLAACTTSTLSRTNSPTTVHMGDNDFVQHSITIKKGDTITLIDDTSATHIINNGKWDSNGNAEPLNEHGAPTVELQFQGNDTQQVGPFNATGTFQLYCTIHTNMNLTVIVQ